MNRRDFVFRSLKAALLFSPILASRRVFAQPTSSAKRVVFWINSSGYPDGDAFFPTGSQDDFTLAPILNTLGHLRDDMVIVDGVDIRNTGPNPKGSNHIQTVGKILTAKDVLTVDHPHHGDPGGISVDQLIANDLGLSSIEQLVDPNAENNMRSKPFATGPRAFKTPIADTEVLWDRVFKGPAEATDPTRLARLRAKKSILDDLGAEMSLFRKELTGIEKVKLDIHEDAIRRAELSVVADLDAAPTLPSTCQLPLRAGTVSHLPTRAQAHFDLLFAALACDLVQVAGMKWAFSGYHWRYEWLDGIHVDSIHNEVHHQAKNRRQDYIDTARWDWEQLGAFVSRLKQTPEGEGSMLDNTLVFATSHFGQHHQMKRIPIVLFGNANGHLKTGRYIKLDKKTYNDKVLTSIAHLMGDPIAGIGDDPTCGPLTALHE